MGSGRTWRGGVGGGNLLQFHTLVVDLLLRAEAEAPQEREGRAPALDRVLEEEPLHDQREEEPASATEDPEIPENSTSDATTTMPSPPRM